MPVIARREQGGLRRQSVWSAGCASGQKPDAIAVMLSELLGTRLSGWCIRTHVFDLGERALQVADKVS